MDGQGHYSHPRRPTAPVSTVGDNHWVSNEPQTQQRQLQHPPPTSNMSTAALSFDPRMDMGMPRSPFGWSGFEQGSEIMGHHDMQHHMSHREASLTPPISSQSITSSPPRSMAADPRELKRQQELARRDSKTSVRARRAMSNYSASQSPPMHMAEFPPTSSMPVYTTAPSQVSLLAEPAPGVQSQPYMPGYAASPPLPDQGQPHMFSAPYDYMNMNYHQAFPPTPPGQSLSSQYGGRPSPMPEAGMMYPVPPVLPSGNGAAPSQEANHVRVVQTRPKPQCWEHGCNGRQFSTFSNLLRHQREKSGQAAKASCPNCGAEFTRTTARNGHLAHDKCKQRRNS